ncbi:SDR family oxidoreductase [Flavobacteriales bacterium AH-315-E23]|nr:SDR family oxidoreductase [Flavobacteriales bacterium AH-315-E23]
MTEERKISCSKVLVTGGAGFIGSNLTERLLGQDNEIICLDNFSTGRRENIEGLLENPKFTLIEGDIRNIDDCRNAVQGVDYVLHQAALGSIPRSIEDPAATNEVNIGGFLNILIASKDENIKRLVYACSSSTYGDHPELPKVEDKIGRPLSPYAVTKYVNELYAGVFSSIYGLETMGLRYFNVFGPRQDPDGAYAAAIPKFIRSLINHESPVIYGDGEQTRDFTYIDNVIQMNQLAATSTNTEALNQIYNVAYGENTTVKELVGLLRELLSERDEEIGSIDPSYKDERLGEVKHSLASIDKAKELLGYDPKYSMREGLEEAISWYWEAIGTVKT